MELRKLTLSEIGPVRMCKRILKEQTNSKEGIPFFKIGTFGGVADSFISQSLYNEYKSKYPFPKKGDVLISAAGTIGRTVIYNGEDAYFQDSNIVWIENDESKVLNSFLFYCYQKIHWYSSTGSTIVRLYNENIQNSIIYAPDISIQRRIVSILSSIDSKIETNNAIISELEAMAKDIYDYWFVQFDFPDENGKPYKSSGGKMVWNEKLKREIPEGWNVKKLNEVVVVNTTRISLADIGDRKYVPIEVIPRNKMSFFQTADIDKAATGLCSFENKSILLSNRRVYFHKVCISPFDGVTRDTVIVINPKNSDNLGFVFQQVNSDHFIDYATRFSYGTEQPVLSTQTALDYDIVYPDKGIDLLYSKKVEGIINMVLTLEKENAELISLRDFLLPLLMNGQVKVGTTEA